VKTTVYRVGDDTPFVRSLIRAAEAGKQVACVIELKARFNEERNLHRAATLVVRKESTGLHAYAHIGTGNYHARTARLYADFGLFTCDPAITQDVVALFHHLTGHSQGPDCKTLLVAPTTMRPRFLELIRREIENKRAGRPARIKPGVPGETDTIRIRSIIDRFLEHARIYYFANGATEMMDGEFYIDSADWMFRNLSKRIEIITPVDAAVPKQRLAEVLEISLRDSRQSWELGSDGVYTRDANAEEALGTHRQLMDLSLRA
jgi:polyphosphate kinase